jgi:hypothetical protein
MFKFKLCDDGWRLFDENTGVQFGEFIQGRLRSNEAKAALIVYEKYKRKYNLNTSDLHSLTEFALFTLENRISQNKKCSRDYLVQLVSEECKSKFSGRCLGSNC